MSATATLVGKMAWDDSALMRGLKSSEDRVNKFVKFAQAASKAIIVLWAAAKIKDAIMAPFTLLKKGLEQAGIFEGFLLQFETLMGSADMAKARMEELITFAAVTPFELNGIAKASKILETMTKGALATGKGLEMVGDTAAFANEPIEEIAVHMGRMYAGLMGGRAVGESLHRLQEIGALSVETRNQIEDLQKQGAKGADVWARAAADLSRFDGTMKKLAGTLQGKKSTLGDSVKDLLRKIGEGAMGEAKGWIDALTTSVNGLAPAAEQFGQTMGNVIGAFRDLFSKETFQMFALELMKLPLEFGLSLDRAMEGTLNAISGVFGDGDAGTKHREKNREKTERVIRELERQQGVLKNNRELGQGFRAGSPVELKAAASAAIEEARKVMRPPVGSGFATPSALERGVGTSSGFSTKSLLDEMKRGNDITNRMRDDLNRYTDIRQN